ncbi:MAG: dihydroorotate dehydrogenase electron transfer subunit [Peptococcales bacterium]|jgi:dihydroorotate dehydrogenase electron transfer subunit
MVVSMKAKILENTQILPQFYLLRLVAPEIANKAVPGQFVMVKVSQNLDPFLKRPISLHRINKESGTIELLYQVIGKGTSNLSLMSQGELEIIGPLGNGFSWEENHKRVALIGGGCGIAPLLALGEELVKQGKEVHVLLGAQTKEKLLNEVEFKKLGCHVQVATDDGSYGKKGFVTEIFKDLLLTTTLDQIYCCGPFPMTKDVIKITQENNIPCQVSLEERMACGVGACLGCVCETRSNEGNLAYQRVCHDGPVFDGDELVTSH